MGLLTVQDGRSEQATKMLLSPATDLFADSIHLKKNIYIYIYIFGIYKILKSLLQLIMSYGLHFLNIVELRYTTFVDCR